MGFKNECNWYQKQVDIGTYAHKDIAFEFGMWISPKFKLLLIKEFELPKSEE